MTKMISYVSLNSKLLVSLIGCAALLSTIFAVPNFSHAQRVQRIAATVNDDVVSQYDLQARMRVVVRTSGLRPTRQLQKRLFKQVLRTLVDERLQQQEAKKRNIRVSKRDLRRRLLLVDIFHCYTVFICGLACFLFQL